MFKDVFLDLLQEREISIRELSKEVDIDDSILYDYKNGIMPSVKYAVVLANYFDCTLSYIFGLTDDPKSFEFSDTYDLSLFSERYQKILDENKTTHFKVCKQSDLNYSSNYAWKRGALPAMNSIVIIAKYFDVSIDYLVGRSDRM